MQKLSNVIVKTMLSMAFLTSLVSNSSAVELPEDVLQSVMWEHVAHNYILDKGVKGQKFVMDANVKVFAPKNAEDQANIPVHVDARGVKDIVKIVVVADLNPIPKVLTYEPIKSDARLSFRIKADQSTPVRAAVLDKSGTWHIGGTYVEAAGGGCQEPALAYQNEDWVSRLAEVRGKIWRKTGKQASRMRVSIRHPMDTGLADGIPAFYLEKLEVKDPNGTLYGRISIYEPVSENPTLTLFPHLLDSTQKVKLEGRDNNGNLIRVKVPAAVQSSELKTQ